MTHRSFTDFRSNRREHIEAALDVLGRAAQRLAVFEAIYYGKKKLKTRDEIVDRTGLSRMRVLQEGNTLAKNHLTVKHVVDGQTAYERLPDIGAIKSEILRFAQNPETRSKLITKRSGGEKKGHVEIVLKHSRPKVTILTIDDIDSFSAVKSIEATTELADVLTETKFKEGIKSIVGEKGEFKDWGGEKNDLYSSRLSINGSRIVTAFAFKGPGTSGKLTPGKMGSNGDQVQRLFATDARLFIVQYVRQVEESIYELMNVSAVAKSISANDDVYYCVIDGVDSKRLVRAYPEHF